MKLTLIGCGLLGGSLALAWRASQQVDQVVGFDLDDAALTRACELGVIDRRAPTLAEAVAGADIVVLAIPVCALALVLGQLSQVLPAQAILTDVGSTKLNIWQAAQSALSSDQLARFVPAHPIAGGALPGIDQARANLFQDKWVITTPNTLTQAAALTTVESLWRSSGAKVQRMSPTEHDDIFAAVSHLPHLLAFALVHQIASQADGAQKLQFAGAGFRDFTRIAASDPAMWRDIALANQGALLAQLQDFRTTLDELTLAVAQADSLALDRMFTLASSVRRQQFPPSAS